MCDRINPPEDKINLDDFKPCDKCGSQVHEYELNEVWRSIQESEEWCKKCTDQYASIHPILYPEFWAIGSTDTENNLTINK